MTIVQTGLNLSYSYNMSICMFLIKKIWKFIFFFCYLELGVTFVNGHFILNLTFHRICDGNISEAIPSLVYGNIINYISAKKKVIKMLV